MNQIIIWVIYIMEANDFEYFKKIVIVGISGSGKSSLTSFFENKEFLEEQPSLSSI